MKQAVFFLFVLAIFTPNCFAEDDDLTGPDSDPYARAHIANMKATEDSQRYEAALAQQEAEREAAITPAMRAKIIAEAKQAALEKMREENRLEEKFMEQEAFRAWERRNPMSALLCQGDRSCMR